MFQNDVSMSSTYDLMMWDRRLDQMEEEELHLFYQQLPCCFTRSLLHHNFPI